eukprot:s471_g8.t1
MLDSRGFLLCTDRHCGNDVQRLKPMTPAQPAVWGPRELDYAVHDLAALSLMTAICSEHLVSRTQLVQLCMQMVEGT